MSDQPADDLPLAGLRVAVPATRRAEETAALIRRWGGDPVVAPLLVEVPVGDEAPLRSATEAVIHARPGWCIHLTGVGTRRWFDQASEWDLLEGLLGTLAGSRLIPRGQKANAALAERGLPAAWVPPRETSAEISAWLAQQLVGGDTVAVQLFGEPAPNLIASLRARGAEVIEVAPYHWELPTDPAQRAAAERLVEAIAGRAVQALVVTSGVQATHLFAVARSLGAESQVRTALTEGVFTAAVGEVAAVGLQREGVQVDLVAEPPRMGALIRSLAGAAAQIRAKSGAPSP